MLQFFTHPTDGKATLDKAMPGAAGAPKQLAHAFGPECLPVVLQVVGYAAHAGASD